MRTMWLFLLGAAAFPERRKAIPEVGQGAREFPEDGVDLDAALADLERSLILAALDRAGGVRKRAAKLLKIKGPGGNKNGWFNATGNPVADSVSTARDFHLTGAQDAAANVVEDTFGVDVPLFGR